MRALWKRHVVDVRSRADAAIQADSDRGAIIVLITAMLCLLLIRFIGMPYEVGRLASLLGLVGADGLASWLLDALNDSPDARINRNIYWSLWRVFGYVVLPLCVIRVALRAKISEFGTAFTASWAFGRIYLFLIALLLPFVVVASYSPEFQASYPFYQVAPGESLWPRFWAWEILYALQFVSLEFFFRGFLLHGLLPRFGYMSIFVMMAPYTMIHFQKPALEAVGSIVAGFALGTLALESRSIWWGAFAHVSIALSMDLLSLWQRGFF